MTAGKKFGVDGAIIQHSSIQESGATYRRVGGSARVAGRVALPRDRRCTSASFLLLVYVAAGLYPTFTPFACSRSLNVQRRSRGSATLPVTRTDTPIRPNADICLPHADPPVSRHTDTFPLFGCRWRSQDFCQTLWSEFAIGIGHIVPDTGAIQDGH